MVLICHMISQGHLIKGSCDFMGGFYGPSCKVTALSSLVAMSIVSSRDVMFVVIEGQNSTCPRLDRPVLFITGGKVFLKILQISQEKTCVRVSFLTS